MLSSSMMMMIGMMSRVDCVSLNRTNTQGDTLGLVLGLCLVVSQAWPTTKLCHTIFEVVGVC